MVSRADHGQGRQGRTLQEFGEFGQEVQKTLWQEGQQGRYTGKGIDRPTSRDSGKKRPYRGLRGRPCYRERAQGGIMDMCGQALRFPVGRECRGKGLR
ncbi:hypothetical protein MNBD_GAMMA03-1997 [hydrothermal vent metagenome]|uniref:Uncharacterized protein n=1 Tax=hydrothermal vent metagenome TaxID=652676 RepID=A0A3B0WKE4_9ZZZZ